MANPTYGSPNFATTLNVGGGINNSQTTGIILASVSGLNSSGGILALDWASTIDTSTYEELEYTGYTGNELTGVTRGVNGFSAKPHNNLATIVSVVSSIGNNRIADKLTSRDATLAQDPNGNEIIKTSYNASAANEVTVTNAATGNAPLISATGSDSNIDLEVKGKGTGKVKATALYGAVTTDTDGATVTLDCSPSGGNRHRVVLGGNRIIALSNTSSGQMVIADYIQDSTGSRTVTHPSTSVAAITMTIATPGVVTLGKDIPTLTPITFTTTGALPTGVTAGTTYYWVRVSSTTGNLATSIANAQAGTLIATSGSQSGVHAAQIQVRWGTNNTIPTLTTGKYQLDTINYYIVDATNGIIQGYTSGTGF